MNKRVIWKYQIPFAAVTAEPTELQVPAGSALIHCAEQGESIAIWFDVPDPSQHKITRRYVVFGTGHGPIPDGAVFVGTSTFFNGSLVLHTFEVLG